MADAALVDSETALRVHDAFAPWETDKSTFREFAFVVGISVVVATAIGAVFEVAIDKWQRGRRTRLACASWLGVQITMNIVLLFVAYKFVYKEFVPYLLLTLAGFAFAVMLFSSQDRLGTNAVCIINW